MPNRNPTPPPRGINKFIVVAGLIVAAMIVVTFVGLNMQHTKDLRDEQAGTTRPDAVPMNQKDLSEKPVQPK